MDESKKGFMKHLGGLSFKKIDDNNYKFSGKIQDIHLMLSMLAGVVYTMLFMEQMF